MTSFETQPVCIVGMHRSGTSMVSRLLNLCGLDLGRPYELTEANKNNPVGYFENKAFNKINRALLSHLGKNWDNPPAIGDGWEADPALVSLAEEGRRVIESFAGSPHWGWKDPKTTVVLPFWQRLLPVMRYVVCLRNPLDVANSLLKRNGFPVEHGAYLWHHYTRAAIRYTEGHRRIFAFYEDFFNDGAAELERLAAFCGLGEAGDRSGALETILPDLRHHRDETSRLLDHPQIAAEHKLFYLGLRALVAGASANSGGESDREAAVSVRVGRLARLFDALRDQQPIAGLESELVEKEQRLRELHAKLQRLEQAATESRRGLGFKLTAALARIFGTGESPSGARKRS
ncbi:MAG: hypothetical protein A3F90_13430 [Deltaproteobacteria bacterium RIFCSPLOWO2_12_FULL_60_19]|nr:MAG: hypothetical protein A3F90_13430 [Deltaproteobacteria bacterium RIFCSPLOWO2_12_FULL_60_19]